MSDPPPPSDPPPGWYPDPSGRPGYRWWDGSSWTESVSSTTASGTADPQPPGPSAIPASTGDAAPIGLFGPWFSQSFRAAIDRAGHFLPMILIFVLSLSVPTSFGLWYALKDTVVSFDPSTAAPSVSYGGSRPWLIVALASVPISAILSFFCKAAVARQVWTAQGEAPEPWSDSVVVALKRWRRVVPYSMGRAAVYWSLGGAFALGLLLSPGFLLLLPFLAAVMFFFWVRLAFVDAVAVLAAPDRNPFSESWRLSGLQIGPLMGRLLVLAFVSINLVLAFGIVGAPFTAIAGGSGNPVEPGADTLMLNDLLGSNPWVFALGSLFNAIGLGASYVLSATGTTLLYRNLGGSAQ